MRFLDIEFFKLIRRAYHACGFKVRSDFKFFYFIIISHKNALRWFLLL